MFDNLIRLVGKRFGKSVRRSKFTRVSYLLSILSFILATLAITLISTIMYSMQQFQKERLLNYTSQIILSYDQPLATQGKIHTSNLQTAYQELSQDKKIAPYLNLITLYSGGKFFLQVNDNLIEGQVFGVDNQNEQAKFKVNSKTQVADNIPQSILAADFPVGSFILAIPTTLAMQYNLYPGSKVNLINSDKSTYLPTGFMPVMRQFTIAFTYDDAGNTNTWYSNLYDIARMNLQSEVKQLNLFLKDPIAIEPVVEQLQQKFHLQAAGVYTYQRNFQQLATVTTNTTSQQPQVVAMSDWRERLAILFSSMKTEGRVTTTLISLLIVIAILSSLITFSFIIVEKDRDVAVLNVLGMPPQAMNQVFLSMVLGLLAKANVISIILYSLIVYIWPYYNAYLNLNIPLQVNYISVALTYLCCSLAIFLATAIAGYFIIRIRPAQILR